MNIIIDREHGSLVNFTPGRMYKIKHYETPTSLDQIYMEGMFIGANQITNGTELVFVPFEDSSTSDTIKVFIIGNGEITEVEDTTDAHAVDTSFSLGGVSVALDCTYSIT